MTKVYVFNDGSVASQLLQKELRERDFDVEVKDGQGLTLEDWFTNLDEDAKIYLHFTYEDYIKDNELLRREVDRVENSGFRNRIVKEYEGLDNKTMEYRAQAKGIKKVQIPEGTTYLGTQDLDEMQRIKESIESGPAILVKDPRTTKGVDPDAEMKEEARKDKAWDDAFSDDIDEFKKKSDEYSNRRKKQ